MCNTLVATLNDAPRVEEAISGALQAGVDYVDDVEFQTTELKEHREEARELALLAAKGKAVKMAGVLAEAAGEPIQVNDGGGDSGYPSGWSWRYGRCSQAQTMSERFREESSETSGTIALGK